MTANTFRAAAGIALVLSAALITNGCASQHTQRETELAAFMQQAVGEYRSEAGAQLLVAGIRSGHIAENLLYVERGDEAGTSGRLVSLEISADDQRVLQRALVFSETGRWRNLRENPELFSALLPRDLKPAGTCDIKLSPDLNEIDYSCSGSRPEIFRRQQ